MQITLIRHLPTEWNKKQVLQGRRDIEIAPVTTASRKKITHNQKLLKDLGPFDFILASSLIRTHQTAQLYHYEPRIEKLLDELDFGPFEGKSKEQLFKECGKYWFENPKKLVLGESMIHLEERIGFFLEKYKKATNILVFGHGSWIRAFISYCHHGHINNMNKITVENNECITLSHIHKGERLEMEG